MQTVALVLDDDMAISGILTRKSILAALAASRAAREISLRKFNQDDKQ